MSAPAPDSPTQSLSRALALLTALGAFWVARSLALLCSCPRVSARVTFFHPRVGLSTEPTTSLDGRASLPPPTVRELASGHKCVCVGGLVGRRSFLSLLLPK